jgi:hypothetical protein
MWDWASIPHNSWKTNKESIKKRIKIYWRLLQTNADRSNRITIAAKFLAARSSDADGDD